MVFTFIGGETWSTRRIPLTSASHSQTLSYNVVSTSPPPHEQGFKLTTLVVIGTNCIGSQQFDHGDDRI